MKRRGGNVGREREVKERKTGTKGRQSAQAIKKESDKEMTFKKEFSFCDFLIRDKRWSSEFLDIGNPRLSHKDT